MTLIILMYMSLMYMIVYDEYKRLNLIYLREFQVYYGIL